MWEISLRKTSTTSILPRSNRSAHIRAQALLSGLSLCQFRLRTSRTARRYSTQVGPRTHQCDNVVYLEHDNNVARNLSYISRDPKLAWRRSLRNLNETVMSRCNIPSLKRTTFRAFVSLYHETDHCLSLPGSRASSLMRHSTTDTSAFREAWGGYSFARGHRNIVHASLWRQSIVPFPVGETSIERTLLTI